MTNPLHVAILWHMHQPYYQDDLTGIVSLPWVRLHAAKDYLHMAEVLEPFPRIRHNFNVVPSLVEQLQSYADGRALDHWLQLSLKPAETLEREEKEFIARHFFSVNLHRIMRRFPRYIQLFELRESALNEPELLSPTYWRDLQAWFNLAWIDPNWLERDAELARLVDQGKNYTDDDVQLIVDKQIQILRQVVPTYRRLAEAGQIELSTTPYYHPILPLLFDVRSAREASPRLELPELRFQYPEDAVEQVQLAMSKHLEVFQNHPEGMWPSEGAVSQAVVERLAWRGTLRWIASDEGILAASLGEEVHRDGYGHVTNPDLLYRPYSVAGGRLAMVFRDQILSDRIGFDYQSWNPVDAANDLHYRLIEIRNRLAGHAGPHLVSIVLDGENCWEGYEHNGDPFLQHFYRRLSDEPSLVPTTIGAFVGQFPPERAVPRLRAGSWIRRNLETWIGEPAQNRAWDLLTQTRERLELWERRSPSADLETASQAWRELYIAEGSDWFWWYYSHNVSDQDEIFDQDFRRHLANVYRIIGLPAPAWLEIPIVKGAGPHASRAPRTTIAPALEPAGTSDGGWGAAGVLVSNGEGGAMQRGAAILDLIRYGNDDRYLYLRLEAQQAFDAWVIRLAVSSPRDEYVNEQFHGIAAAADTPELDVPFGAEIQLDTESAAPVLYTAQGDERWLERGPIGEVARSERAVNVRVPLSALGLRPGDRVGLVVGLSKDGVLAELLPRHGKLAFVLRSEKGED